MAVHSVRASRALQRLAENDPALAALALWIDHRDGETGELPALSGEARILYGPAFGTLSLAEQTGLAAHHILHVAFRHARRAAAMRVRMGAEWDPALFVLAADAILNEAVLAAGHIVPRPAPILSELLAEVLPTVPQTDALARWDVERLALALLTEGAEAGRPAAEAARAYAARMGHAPDLEPAPSGEGTTPEDAEWRQRVARAMEAGRLAGRGIGRLGQKLADLPQPRVPWERHLRGLLARAVMDTPRLNWARPTGRWLARDASGQNGPFEPARARRSTAPRIAVGLDASSSVEPAALNRLGAEIAGIARRTGAETHVLVFDEVVQDRAVIPAGGWAQGLPKVAIPRDGGTDFAPVLAEAAALDPAVIVMLTDLDAPLPARPSAPVVWAVPEAPRAAPAWGRVVTLDG